MDLKFSAIASSRTDEELLACIENRQLYLPETIEASIAELQHRGHAFSEEELSVIEQDVQAHRNNAAIPGRRIGFANSSYKNNIVQDPDAPALYSRQAIYGFTFLCGALFGSIMMAINMAKIKNNNNIIWVLLFGALYTILEVVIVQSAHTSNALSIILNIAGAIIMESLLWNRFIGNATFYRLKPIWIPLKTIGLLIFGVVLLSFFITPPQ